MYVRCCRCQIFIGEKEPYNDLETTHTYCPLCLEEEKKTIEILRQQIQEEHETDLLMYQTWKKLES